LDLLNELDFWSAVSAFIPVIGSLFLFKHTTNTLSILGVFVFFNMVHEYIALAIAYEGIPNAFMFHLHTILEFIFVCLLSAKIIQTLNFTRLIIILCICFTAFCFIDAYFIEGWDAFNFLPRGIEGILAISISIYFFYRLFTAEESLDLLRYPYFWLFTGWLIYFSGTFFLFIYNDSAGFDIIFPLIHSVLNILLNLVYTYTLWLGSRKSTYH
jgi:hypothetical protein